MPRRFFRLEKRYFILKRYYPPIWFYLRYICIYNILCNIYVWYFTYIYVKPKLPKFLCLEFPLAYIFSVRRGTLNDYEKTPLFPNLSKDLSYLRQNRKFKVDCI